MALIDIINRVSRKPNYDETSDMGQLETFDPSYDRTKPDWESGVAPSQSENDVVSNPDSGPKSSVKSGDKRKPLTNQDRNALRNDESKDRKKKEIEKLLADYDKATQKRKSSNLAAGLSEAGMEFGHAFGGQAVDKNFVNGVRERGNSDVQDMMKKNDLDLEHRKEFRDQDSADQHSMMNAQSMDNTSLDMEKKQDSLNNEDSMLDTASEESNMARQIAADMGIEVPATASARDITNVLPFVKERMAEKKATEHETASTKRTGIQQGNANLRNSQDNKVKVAVAGINQQSRDSVAGLRGDELRIKLGERAIPGFKFKDFDKGYMPTITGRNEADDMVAAHDGLAVMMDDAMRMLNANGKNVMWTKSWNQLKSKWASIAQSLNKRDKNGVMNFNDWDNIMQEIGDPNTANQWIANGGAIRMQEARKNSEIKFKAFMEAHGYTPGQMDLSKVPGFSGVGMGGKSGNNVKMTTGDINAQLQSAGIPEISGQKSPETPPIPQQTQSVDHGPVVESTTSFIKYQDGFIARKGVR